MLSIVSTPIGNLKDITLRSLDALRECELIACEDTRVTGQLLKLLDLPKKELISLHSYSDPAKADAVIERLKKGATVCLVSDAGTPGISDPGYLLISKARAADIKIEVLPGASAFLAALSASGLPINHFRYLGFLPIKKGRQTLLKSFIEEADTIVFYESPHRIQKTLSELAQVLADQPERVIVIARELTKLHEEVIRTTVEQLPMVVGSMMVKGEFVVIVAGNQ